MADNKNYILAIVLSVVVLFGWQYFVAQPKIEAERARQAELDASGSQTGTPGQGEAAVAPQTGDTLPQVGARPEGSLPALAPSSGPLERGQAIASSPRIPFENGNISGSISLVGGRIDDLTLKQYRTTIEDDAPLVTVLSPSGTQDPYYADFGWVSGNTALALPQRGTEWQLESGERLTPGNPVVLSYDNGQGLIFRRTISLDSEFMFSIADTVENTSGNDVVLNPYGLVSRHSLPVTEHYTLFHEGYIGVFGETGLEEVYYTELEDETNRTLTHTAGNGWLGITDKYWATVLIPATSGETTFTGRFLEGLANGRPTYQADYLMPGLALPAGGTVENTHLFFAGAKEVPVINAYNESLGIDRFELLIDWGWLYFITKPMFQALKFFGELTGNFGVAILIVTFLIKLVFFPLSNKAYASMSRMKKIQPELEKLREKHKEDKVKLQQGMMELYKREKINPLAGCLPILIQIPVFFSIYKVLLVTIEMRHAPFFGWIEDLSAVDPTSIFNLFGLLPYDVPSYLIFGAWPLMMGITMFVQMKLNPPPPDPTQRMLFDFMPFIFTILLASFPAGLVIYWTWNNLLTILQQSFIMHRQGVDIDLWGNVKNTFRYKKSKA